MKNNEREVTLKMIKQQVEYGVIIIMRKVNTETIRYFLRLKTVTLQYMTPM